METATMRSCLKKCEVIRSARKTLFEVVTTVFAYYPLNFYSMTDLSSRDVQCHVELVVRQGTLGDMRMIDDLLALTYVSPDATSRRNLGKCFDSGGRVFLAFSNGRLVHAAWLHDKKSAEHVFSYIEMKPDQALIGQCCTDPEYRGKSVYPFMLQQLARYAFSENFRKCYITTTPRHTPSVRGILKAGFALEGTLHRFRLLGLTFNSRWKCSD